MMDFIARMTRLASGQFADAPPARRPPGALAAESAPLPHLAVDLAELGTSGTDLPVAVPPMPHMAYVRSPQTDPLDLTPQEKAAEANHDKKPDTHAVNLDKATAEGPRRNTENGASFTFAPHIPQTAPQIEHPTWTDQAAQSATSMGRPVSQALQDDMLRLSEGFPDKMSAFVGLPHHVLSPPESAEPVRTTTEPKDPRPTPAQETIAPLSFAATGTDPRPEAVSLAIPANERRSGGINIGRVVIDVQPPAPQSPAPAKRPSAPSISVAAQLRRAGLRRL